MEQQGMFLEQSYLWVFFLKKGLENEVVLQIALIFIGIILLICLYMRIKGKSTAQSKKSADHLIDNQRFKYSN